MAMSAFPRSFGTLRMTVKGNESLPGHSELVEESGAGAFPPGTLLPPRSEIISVIELPSKIGRSIHAQPGFFESHLCLRTAVVRVDRSIPSKVRRKETVRHPTTA